MCRDHRRRPKLHKAKIDADPSDRLSPPRGAPRPQSRRQLLARENSWRQTLGSKLLAANSWQPILFIVCSPSCPRCLTNVAPLPLGRPARPRPLPVQCLPMLARTCAWRSRAQTRVFGHFRRAIPRVYGTKTRVGDMPKQDLSRASNVYERPTFAKRASGCRAAANPPFAPPLRSC